MSEPADRLTIERGPKSAVFLRDQHGWRPDWFYLAKRPMLRFKDYQWLSLGHVKPTHAREQPVRTYAGGLIFTGHSEYGGTVVHWRVEVTPDPHGPGFLVITHFKHDSELELLEAFTSFETPYEYDGSEHATTVIGQNPVIRWHGQDRQSPPLWQHPAWMYNRRQAARQTGSVNLPIVCHHVSDADGGNARLTTLVGDWNYGRVHDVYATPTRSVPDPARSNGDETPAEKRGYKLIVGALNWSSAAAKDPNVMFKAGKGHGQLLAIDFADAPPEQQLDRALLAAWRRAERFDRPKAGRVTAFDRISDRGVSWRAACDWLRGVFVQDQPRPGLFHPTTGLYTYAPGTRPKADASGTWQWWPQWAGPLHYRSRVLGDIDLSDATERNDRRYAEAGQSADFYGQGIANTLVVNPTLWWLSQHPDEANEPLLRTLGPALERLHAISVAENDQPQRAMDGGGQAVAAEAMLLASRIWPERHDALVRQALHLIDEINAKLDGAFWDFNMGPTGSLDHVGQIRPLGHGHAALANFLAWRATESLEYLHAAARFARYLIAIHYTTHNGSEDPDFDWRGWANGSNAGRDQLAEFPPWETLNSLLCLAPLLTVPLSDADDLQEALLDVLWYIARTGLAMFPAARSLKRVYDETYRVHYVPRYSLASERDFYDTLPFLAYENPHDQTMLASYQGTDCLIAELAIGHGLVRPSDDRLQVVIPDAVMFAPDLLHERLAVVWNPLNEPITASLAAVWPDGTATQQTQTFAPRRCHSLRFLRSLAAEEAAG